MCAGKREDERKGDEIPPDARAVLTIDLDALRHNWQTLNDKAGQAECAGLVKADAYGLGLERIATALRRGGCTTYFVATLAEGRRLRNLDPSTTIYILDGLMPGSAAYFAGFNLRPVLSSLAEVEEWSAYCQALGQRLSAALHLDTGMNRLGMLETDVDRLAANPGLLDTMRVTLVMSHLACADEPGHPMNETQRLLFDRLRAKLPPYPASLSNSGGVFLGPHYHYDLVRPGIAVYGGRAVEGRPNPMRPVVKLEARILQIRDIPAGGSIGYGGTYRVAQDMRAATIACGYADGFLRALSGPSGHPGPLGYIGEHAVPVVGRVSMDLITIDVTHVPAKLAVRGGFVELMGERTTVDDLTDRAGTIGYELLTRLGRRVHRIYRG